MRINLRKIFILAISLIVGLLLLNGLMMYVLYKYGGTDIETRKFNMLISGLKTIYPEGELAYALQWYGNWDNIFLTENFKKKYKNRKGILLDVNKYENICGFMEYDYIPGEKLIGISLDKKINIIETVDPDFVAITRDYYFRYKVDDNGYLDDIELVGQQDFDAETGFPIGDDREEYHTIS